VPTLSLTASSLSFVQHTPSCQLQAYAADSTTHAVQQPHTCCDSCHTVVCGFPLLLLRLLLQLCLTTLTSSVFMSQSPLPPPPIPADVPPLSLSLLLLPSCCSCV
jgi:hypothetical protein